MPPKQKKRNAADMSLQQVTANMSLQQVTATITRQLQDMHLLPVQQLLLKKLEENRRKQFAILFGLCDSCDWKFTMQTDIVVTVQNHMCSSQSLCWRCDWGDNNSCKVTYHYNNDDPAQSALHVVTMDNPNQYICYGIWNGKCVKQYFPYLGNITDTHHLLIAIFKKTVRGLGILHDLIVNDKNLTKGYDRVSYVKHIPQLINICDAMDDNLLWTKGFPPKPENIAWEKNTNPRMVSFTKGITTLPRNILT